MKLKKLTKKIRRLEARLQRGEAKLADLKRKLKAGQAAKLAKAKSKSSARTRKALTVRGTSEPVPTVRQRLMAMTAPKAERARQGRSFEKLKRKRHITPERRAQLSAAMKARWAAKRAAVATPEPNSQEQTAASEETPQQ